MVIPSRKGHKKGDSKKIKVEEERDKKKEVILRYRIVPPKWKTWNDEDFSWEWNKTYLTHKREINPK